MRRLIPAICVLWASAAMAGCHWRHEAPVFAHATGPPVAGVASTEIAYPDVHSVAQEPLSLADPRLLSDPGQAVPRDLTLAEAVQLALVHSEVIRDLGGTVLKAPEAAVTVHDIALTEADPSFGVAAALSEFDASFAARTFFENNDRAVNNSFLGGGTRQLKQDLGLYQFELSKRAASGADLFLRKNIDYDSNNAPGNAFPSAWNTILEGEIRQPLLQGAGADFNRTAGPNALPGVTNGVLLARLDTDISITEFEKAVRDVVSDVEDAYWELYYAYRELDAKIECRDQALETWRAINALTEERRTGGELENEAQAREQYYRFQAEVQNALAGQPLERTRSQGFRAIGGVYSHERRLRWLIGIPLNDGTILRPVDEPPEAPIVYSWSELEATALARRAELRQQAWRIRRAELELLANRNFLMPRLDAIARYRWRGFGKDLIATDRSGRATFDNAFMNLTTGDFQEWQMGLELTIPIGFRRAMTAVRHSELKLARERSLLVEQQRLIVHDLSTALVEVDRAYEVIQTTYQRRYAAIEQLNALRARDPAPNQQTLHLKLVLDGQRRLCEAEIAFYRARAAYARAIKELHYHRGTLLDYDQIYLAEGGLPVAAYEDAAELEAWRRPAHLGDRLVHPGPVVGQGVYPQQSELLHGDLEILPPPSAPAEAAGPLPPPSG